MARNTDIMRTAQFQLDSVLGGRRLPGHSDLDSLPCIVAIVKETLRWAPPLPIGTTHRLMEDDVYRGMFIPGGATVVENIWWGSSLMVQGELSIDVEGFQGHLLRRSLVSRATHVQPGSVP